MAANRRSTRSPSTGPPWMASQCHPRRQLALARSDNQRQIMAGRHGRNRSRLASRPSFASSSAFVKEFLRLSSVHLPGESRALSLRRTNFSSVGEALRLFEAQASLNRWIPAFPRNFVRGLKANGNAMSDLRPAGPAPDFFTSFQFDNSASNGRRSSFAADLPIVACGVSPTGSISAGERVCEKRQALIHAVIDTGVVVGKFLVAMRNSELGQPPHKPAGAIEQVELVVRAAVDIERLQPAQIVGLRFDRDGRILPQPIRPALLDDLAGIERDRQPDPEELGRIWIVARCHRQRVDDLAGTVRMLFGGFELLPPLLDRVPSPSQ